MDATSAATAMVTGMDTAAGSNNRSGLIHLDHIGYFSLSINLIAIVAGNIALLVFVSSRPKCRMTMFITNLGVSDLCVGLFCVLPQFIDRVLMQFYGPEILCKLKFFSQTLVSYGAAYALVVLSIDRVDAIANPLRASTSRRKSQTTCLIAGSWILSGLYSSPAFIWTHVRQHSKFGRQCAISYGSGVNTTTSEEKQNFWQIFVTTNLVTIIIIPVTLVAVCHIALIVIIYRSGLGPKVPSGVTVNRSSSAASAAGGSAAGGRGAKRIDVSSGSGGGCSTNRANTISRAKVKTVKVTCTIVSVFILCWMPYTIGNFLDVFHVTRLNIYVKVFIQTLGTLNSAANPIIFFIFNYNNTCCSRDRLTQQQQLQLQLQQHRKLQVRSNYQMVLQRQQQQQQSHHLVQKTKRGDQHDGDNIGEDSAETQLYPKGPIIESNDV